MPSAEAFLIVLNVLRDKAKAVRRGSSYRFAIPQGLLGANEVEGEATISDGHVTRIVLDTRAGGHTYEVRYVFSLFDSAIYIDAPPISRVVDEGPALQPCGADGSPPPSQIICGSVGTP